MFYTLIHLKHRQKTLEIEDCVFSLDVVFLVVNNSDSDREN